MRLYPNIGALGLLLDNTSVSQQVKLFTIVAVQLIIVLITNKYFYFHLK